MQTVVITPCLDIVLPDQVKRPDKLHALKVCTVKLRHHGLYLCTVEHAHEYRLYNIIIMMSERNFVAAQLLCKCIQMSSSHPRT